MLAIIETHPVQYRAPIYRLLHQKFNIPITVIYGSDFSVAGYQDREFGAKFAWDVDLLSDYPYRFLSKVKDGGASCYEEVSSQGLKLVLEELTPQAVLITGYNHSLYRSAFYLALRNNYSIIFRAETSDRAIERNVFKAWGRDTVLRWLYRRCDRLLYIGKNSLAHYQRLGCDSSKLLLSPYCVDISPFQVEEKDRLVLRQKTRQELGIADDKLVLLFSGKLSPRKRPDLILAAIKTLSREYRERLAVIYLGDGELRESLATEANSEPQIDTYFLGFQNQTQLSQYYHAADALVLPSAYSETWGLVVNEALHHGLPAIVSDAVGCAPDLVIPGKTGEIFTTNSSRHLAEAIEKMVPIMNNLATRTNCRDQVNNYTVSIAAYAIATAYQNTINSNRRSL